MTDAPGIPDRARPSVPRATAAARLAGAESSTDAVAARMRHAAVRSRSAVLAAPLQAAVSVGAAALAIAAPVRRAAPHPDEQPRPRHLRVVPDGHRSAAQRRRRARAILLAGIGSAAAIGLALVYFHVVLAQRQFALDRLDNQVQQAQSTYQESRLHVAQLGSPQHIISMAEGQLGMVQPSNVTYLTPAGGASVSSGALGPSSLQTAGQPGSPAPAGDANWPRIKQQLAGIP